MKSLLAGIGLLVAATAAFAAPCQVEDFATRVSGESECLLMRRYGSLEPATMVVWLHGNVTTGGPANSHFAIAQKLAEDFADAKLLAVALVRPGYPDGSGASSSGNSFDRADNWREANIVEIGTAIERLRGRYRPQQLVIVGHSGGAAIAAVLMGLKPRLAEAALLVACPCDVGAWRAGRRSSTWFSENPIRWVDAVDPATRVIALTGSRDDTTAPELAEDYIRRLQARGIDAVFQLAPGLGHIDVIRSPAVSEATSRLLHR